MKSFVEKIEADDEKVKMYYTILCPLIASRRRQLEFYLSYTTVEGEGDTGGEVDNKYNRL